MPERVTIRVTETRLVSGVLHIPVGAPTGVGIVVAHGAGHDMESPLCVRIAEGLASVGHTALRFNFPYKEAGRRRPDPPAVLEATSVAAGDYLRPRAQRL